MCLLSSRRRPSPSAWKPCSATSGSCSILLSPELWPPLSDSPKDQVGPGKGSSGPAPSRLQSCHSLAFLFPGAAKAVSECWTRSSFSSTSFHTSVCVCVRVCARSGACTCRERRGLLSTLMRKGGVSCHSSCPAKGRKTFFVAIAGLGLGGWRRERDLLLQDILSIS